MARTTVNLTPRRGLSRKNSYSGLSSSAANDSVLPHTQQSGGLYSHFERSSDEELPNLAITLCRQVDKMMTTWLEKLEEDFKENGGLSERMTALRLGHRKTQQETIEAQAHEIDEQKDRIKKLETNILQLERTSDNSKQRTARNESRQQDNRVNDKER